MDPSISLMIHPSTQSTPSGIEMSEEEIQALYNKADLDGNMHAYKRELNLASIYLHKAPL